MRTRWLDMGTTAGSNGDNKVQLTTDWDERSKYKDWDATVSTKLGSATTMTLYERSPLNRRASWISLGWIVTRLAWMAARLVLLRAAGQHRSNNDGMDRDSLLEERYEVGLSRLLESHDSRRLESQVGLEVLSNLANETLEAVGFAKVSTRRRAKGRRLGRHTEACG